MSGAGVQVGGFRDPLGASRSRNNTIRDCVIEDVVVEFSGAAGVSLGYTEGAVVEHNTLRR